MANSYITLYYYPHHYFFSYSLAYPYTIHSFLIIYYSTSSFSQTFHSLSNNTSFYYLSLLSNITIPSHHHPYLISISLLYYLYAHLLFYPPPNMSHIIHNHYYSILSHNYPFYFSNPIFLSSCHNYHWLFFYYPKNIHNLLYFHDHLNSLVIFLHSTIFLYFYRNFHLLFFSHLTNKVL